MPRQEELPSKSTLEGFTTPIAAHPLTPEKFDKLDPSQQQQVTKYMNELLFMEPDELEKEKSAQLVKAVKSGDKYSKQSFLELAKLHAVQFERKNRPNEKSTMEPYLEMFSREIPGYNDEISAYQEGLKEMDADQLEAEEVRQEVNYKKVIPSEEAMEADKRIESAKFAAVLKAIKKQKLKKNEVSKETARESSGIKL